MGYNPFTEVGHFAGKGKRGDAICKMVVVVVVVVVLVLVVELIILNKYYCWQP